MNNDIFVPYEELDLEKMFGAEFLEDKKNVSGWISRLKPFIPDSVLK